MFSGMSRQKDGPSLINNTEVILRRIKKNVEILFEVLLMRQKGTFEGLIFEYLLISASSNFLFLNHLC